jgi:phosphomannomutase / phosphoglucomutase
MATNLNPHIFRKYDIRGIVGVDLNNQFAYLLGRAYAGLAKDNNKNQIGIGYDCRLSSEGFASELARGMCDEGIDVVVTGMGPTPQTYYSIRALELGGAIQVTGSHNPSNMNGFKMCIGTHTLSGDEIQNLYQRIKSLPDQSTTSRKGTKTEVDFRKEYAAMLVKNSKPFVGPRKLKIVCDGGNGVGGLVGPEVLRELGYEIIELYCEPDGQFPNHHPDPTEPHNLVDLIAKVKETGADFGIGWDGDADRIGVVDENGDILYGDMLLLIYAREILKKKPGSTFIGDVKCSSRLFDDLRKRGAKAVMWKTGHSLIKQKLIETDGELAGEMSGHIFFKDRFYGFDDALYASCRFAEIVSNTDMQVSELIKDLPPAISTPEIRVDCPDEVKFKIAERAIEAFKDYEVEVIDGVRINFKHGWGLVRASNTQPVLVMRFEAENEELLNQYQETVMSRLEKIKAEVM